MPKPSRRRPTPVFALEPLEPRCLLSASASLHNGVLRIHGTHLADVITVESADSLGDVEVVVNGQVLMSRLAIDIRKIVVNGGAGNDQITIQPLTPGRHGKAINAKLIGGAGDDTLTGGNGNDIIKGGAGNDTLIDGAGNDTLDGGSGNDTFEYGQAGDGNNKLLGGSGNDVFNGTADDSSDPHKNSLYPGSGANQLATSPSDHIHGRTSRDTVTQAPPANSDTGDNNGGGGGTGDGGGGGTGDGGGGTNGGGPVPIITIGELPSNPHPPDATPISIISQNSGGLGLYVGLPLDFSGAEIINSQADLQAAGLDYGPLASVDFSSQTVVVAATGPIYDPQIEPEITGVFQSGNTVWVQGLVHSPGPWDIRLNILFEHNAGYAVVVNKIDGDPTVLPDFISVDGAGNNANATHPPDAASVPFINSVSASTGGPSNFGFSIIRSQAALDAAFAFDVHGSPGNPAPANLNVDFDTQMVILLSVGEKSTGGYTAQINAVYNSDTTLWVQASITTPAPGDTVTQGLTQPYAAVVVNKMDNVRLVSETELETPFDGGVFKYLPPITVISVPVIPAN